MAKQDKLLFPYIGEDVTNDNQFMHTLLCEYEYDTPVDMRKNPIQALYSKINHFGSFEKYLAMLKLENSLSSTLNKNLPIKKMKI